MDPINESVAEEMATAPVEVIIPTEEVVITEETTKEEVRQPDVCTSCEG